MSARIDRCCDPACTEEHGPPASHAAAVAGALALGVISFLLGYAAAGGIA